MGTKKTASILILIIGSGSCAAIFAYMYWLQPKPLNLLPFYLWWILNSNPGPGNWTWMSGTSHSPVFGNYGKKGVAVASNVPGVRYDSISWIDSDDNLWLFGGVGYNNVSLGYLNDLWKFNITTGLWTWVSGTHLLNEFGNYGKKGMEVASNVPGGRAYSISWIDSNDTLWLFGGGGYNNASFGRLNDLWQFSTITLEWTWISGNYTVNERGVYGSRGVAAPSNIPGAREASISWIDSNDTLWLFGGFGFDNFSLGSLNDLWNFDGTYWTWVSGANLRNQLGYYGTKGVTAPSNVPGARYDSISWIDSNDDLWLFGGRGYNNVSGGSLDDNLNDLWKFDMITQQWTWVSGTHLLNQTGSYGLIWIEATTNVPGARHDSISWKDSNDSLWLFGGYGYNNIDEGYLNDLWIFNTTSLYWTWVSGTNFLDQVGKYGIKGVTTANNLPGGREKSISWIDSNDTFWLFGGHGYDKYNLAIMNDLWKYEP